MEDHICQTLHPLKLTLSLQMVQTELIRANFYEFRAAARSSQYLRFLWALLKKLFFVQGYIHTWIMVVCVRDSSVHSGLVGLPSKWKQVRRGLPDFSPLSENCSRCDCAVIQKTKWESTLPFSPLYHKSPIWKCLTTQTISLLPGKVEHPSDATLFRMNSLKAYHFPI